MKAYRILILALACLAGGVFAKSQTLSALPTPTTHSVALSLTNNCTNGVTCQFNYYRCTGTIAICSLGSQFWQLINATPTGTSTTDTTVTAGTTYAYVAYAVAGTQTSGPSNEVAATIPLGPSAPTGLSGVAQ